MCPTPDDGRDRDSGGALSPDDLDIEDNERVVPLDEGRYVIGTEGRPSVPSETGERSEETAAASSDGNPERSGDDTVDTEGSVDSGSAKRWLEDDLRDVSVRYGFHVTAKAEDSVNHQQMLSDDVTTVFDGLLRWYARQLTTETAVEDVLGILLTESNVRVRYSSSCLQAILDAHDLDPEDSIADLYDAVQDGQGMVFPPENV